jgi:tetraacyldisaccharide 4'-kinase
VICVGNLTVGGTGKTPVVRELLRLLTVQGVAAHGLSRGYGGRLKGPLRVDPAVHTAADVGDEPLMLARDFPLWISPDRPAGALAAKAGGAQVLVMDDGHQNPSLKKALSLVVVDGETRKGEWPFGDGAVFPAGPMREPLAAGLARTDAVIMLLPADMAAPDPELMALFAGGPVFVARLEPSGPPPPGPQVGFAGIGKPWKVERSLEAAGCDLKDFVRFPDHHAYSAADLALLEEVAPRHGRSGDHRKGLGPPAGRLAGQGRGLARAGAVRGRGGGQEDPPHVVAGDRRRRWRGVRAPTPLSQLR